MELLKLRVAHSGRPACTSPFAARLHLLSCVLLCTSPSRNLTLHFASASLKRWGHMELDSKLSSNMIAPEAFRWKVIRQVGRRLLEALGHCRHWCGIRQRDRAAASWRLETTE